MKRLVPATLRPCAVAARLLADALAEPRVLGGIFRGMKYVSRSGLGSKYLPKVLGSYEVEIQSALVRFLRMTWDAIVNVGAGEGWYACGCAVRTRHTPVFAFESARDERTLIREMAERNGVAQRIVIRGMCTLPDLESLLERHPRALVIMDVEGEEGRLLSGRVPALCTRAALVVEIHDFLDGSLFDQVTTRVRATHRLRCVWTRPRTVWNSPSPGLLLRLYLRHHILKHMDEGRNAPMRWIVAEPRGGRGWHAGRA